MLFIRLGRLEDRIVGRATDGKRRAIRRPASLLGLKKINNGLWIGVASIVAGGLMFLGAVGSFPGSITAFMCLFSLGLALTAGGVVLTAWGLAKRSEMKSLYGIMGPLLSKDPYLDLQSAAFLTVGAMPEWLKTQMDSEPDSVEAPGWQKTRLAAEPYTVERAGFDYLRLMSRIEDSGGETSDTSFYGAPFPSLDYRLPDSLKEAVGKIVLFLSSLPDSEEAPSTDAMEAVIGMIDGFATIDGESFTAVVRRLYEEEASKKKADYDGEVMRAVDTTKNALTARTDEGYKAILRGMDRLSKISKECERAAVSADVQRASITR